MHQPVPLLHATSSFTSFATSLLALTNTKDNGTTSFCFASFMICVKEMVILGSVALPFKIESNRSVFSGSPTSVEANVKLHFAELVYLKPEDGFLVSLM